MAHFFKKCSNQNSFSRKFWPQSNFKRNKIPSQVYTATKDFCTQLLAWYTFSVGMYTNLVFIYPIISLEHLLVKSHLSVCLSALFGSLISQQWLHHLKRTCLKWKLAISLEITQFNSAELTAHPHKSTKGTDIS